VTVRRGLIGFTGLPPPTGMAILGDMGEGDDYREPDDAPHWSDSPTARLLMIAGAVVAAFVVLGLLA
jgi:hypothetical protein